MNDERAIAIGALVVTLLGLVGVVVPVVGAAVAAFVGGGVTGALSDAENRAGNGLTAGFLGGVLPAFAAILSFAWRSTIHPPPMTPDNVLPMLPEITPYALLLALLLALPAAAGARLGAYTRSPLRG